MTFAEQAAELHRLEAVAASMGMSDRSFEDLVLAVLKEAPDASPEKKLEEIRRRVMTRAQRNNPLC